METLEEIKARIDRQIRLTSVTVFVNLAVQICAIGLLLLDFPFDNITILNVVLFYGGTYIIWHIAAYSYDSIIDMYNIQLINRLKELDNELAP